MAVSDGMVTIGGVRYRVADAVDRGLIVPPAPAPGPRHKAEPEPDPEKGGGEADDAGEKQAPTRANKYRRAANKA